MISNLKLSRSKNLNHFFISFLISFLLFSACTTPTKVEPEEELEPALEFSSSFIYDEINGFILYNGINKEVVEGVLELDSKAYFIETTDLSLINGKEYILSIKDSTYKFFYTELPLISINTYGEDIFDDPKINAKLKILETGVEPTFFDIGIEIRGGVSKKYPKKSYSVELWEDSLKSETLKTSLLGMRVDDDWVLDGLWNEPVRVRDFTSHDLWLEMGRVQHGNDNTKPGIDRVYCEIFINNEYKGIYYLGEKVDRKQLDLKKYETEMQGELYKGSYWAPGVRYLGLDEYDNNLEIWSGYEAKYPDEVGELDWSNLHNFTDFVINSDQQDFESNIAKKLDLDNAVDYFLFLNVVFAPDNTGKNIYTAKHSQSDPYYFIPWDIDGSFGNDWQGERIDIITGIQTNGLFDRLLSTSAFRAKVKSRWQSLRNSTFNEDYLKTKFRNNYDYLLDNNLFYRESLVAELSFNYSDTEIDFIESWIERRLDYLDNYVSSL